MQRFIMAELNPESVVALLPSNHAVLLTKAGGSSSSIPRYFCLNNEKVKNASTNQNDDDMHANVILKKYVSGVQKIQRICTCAAIDTQNNKVFLFKQGSRVNEVVSPAYILIFKTKSEAHKFYTDYVAEFPKIIEMRQLLKS